MAAFLRNAKVFRIFSSFTRNVARSYIQSERLGVQIQQGKNIRRKFIRALATQNVQYGTELEPDSRSSESVYTKGTLELDRKLFRLDQEIRRSGRVTLSEVEGVFALMKETGKVTSTQALLAIRCCGNFIPEEFPEVRTRLLEDIWDFLKSSGVPMDVSHYNALLRVYIENEKKFSPTEYLAYLEKEGMEPNRVTYQRLITRYCQDGDIEGASRILEFMKEKNLPVNEHVFNSLIMGHANNGDMQNARATVEMMQNAGLNLNVETYIMLMCGYARSGDMEKILATIEECEDQDIVLHSKDLFEVLYSLVINGHGQYIDKIVEKTKVTAGYNQDAINICLRLILSGHDEAAYSVFNTMPRPLVADKDYHTGSFFIGQLMKCEAPFDKIIFYCEDMMGKGLTEAPLLQALYTSLLLERTDITMEMFDYFIQNNIPLKEHYFWPLLMTYAKKQDEEGLLQVVSRMKTSLQTVRNETIENYVMPNLGGSFESRIEKLVKCGLSYARTVVAAFTSALGKNDVAAAVNIAVSMRVKYPKSVSKDLVSAYIRTGDIEPILKLLHIIDDIGYYNLPDSQEIGSVDRDESSDIQEEDFVDVFVLDMLFKINNQEEILSVLKRIVELGMGISSKTAQKLSSALGSEAQETILLAAGIRSLAASKQGGPKSPQLTTDNRKYGMYGNQPKLTILLNNIRNQELETAMDMKKELEAEGYEILPGILALLIDLQLSRGNLEETQQLVKEMKMFPGSVLGTRRILKMAHLLAKENRYGEALTLLKQESSEDANYPKRMDRVDVVCNQLFNVLLDAGDAHTIEEFIDVLLKYKYTHVSTGLCRPLVKVHVNRNDVITAVAAFENCCKKYKETPMSNVLLKKLIEMEDSANLHKVSELMMDIHGEMNVLYDLICIFIECGRADQARKILKTPGMRANNWKMEQRCEQYVETGKVKELEELVRMTKDIFSLNRSMMYSYLLKAYCQVNDVERAISVWMLLQEEGLQPSDDFLINLAKLLQKNNRAVPFVVPHARTELADHDDRMELPLIQKLQLAIKSGDVDEAISCKKQLDSNNITLYSIHMRSILLALLAKENRISEACEFADEMMSQNLNTRRKEMAMFFQALAINGEVDLIEHFSSLGENRATVETFIIKAYVTAGRIEEYITKLEKECQLYEPGTLNVHFPFEDTVQILDQHPEFLPRYEELAKQYAARNIISLMSTIWRYHLKQGNTEKANQLWNEYLKSNEHFVNVILPRTTKRWRAEVGYVETVMKLLPEINLLAEGKSVIYSSMIQLLCNEKQFERGLEILQESLDKQQLTLNHYATHLLHTLQQGLESLGKTLPYTIPEESVSQNKLKHISEEESGTSSDSDDESDRKVI